MCEEGNVFIVIRIDHETLGRRNEEEIDPFAEDRVKKFARFCRARRFDGHVIAVPFLRERVLCVQGDQLVAGFEYDLLKHCECTLG